MKGETEVHDSATLLFSDRIITRERARVKGNFQSKIKSYERKMKVWEGKGKKGRKPAKPTLPRILSNDATEDDWRALYRKAFRPRGGAWASEEEVYVVTRLFDLRILIYMKSDSMSGPNYVVISCTGSGSRVVRLFFSQKKSHYSLLRVQ